MCEMAGLQVERGDVDAIVRDCARCRVIDPNPVALERGDLSVDNMWSRLAVDITHYGNQLYLTCIDCGPSRFAVWRLIIR